LCAGKKIFGRAALSHGGDASTKSLARFARSSQHRARVVN
jgi:hypothetical protein